MQRRGEVKQYLMGADGALPICRIIGGSLEQVERPGRRKQVTKENIFSPEMTLPLSTLLLTYLKGLPKTFLLPFFFPNVSISAQTVMMKVNKKDMFI